MFLAVCCLWSWPTGLGQRIAGKEKGPKKQLCFTIIGDIGGLPKPPFTTWMQRKVADEMEKVKNCFLSEREMLTDVKNPCLRKLSLTLRVTQTLE